MPKLMPYIKAIFLGIIVSINLVIILISLSFKVIPSDHHPIFIQKLSSLCWICYAPSQLNPRKQIYPSIDSIKADLQILKKAGFNGVITFGAEKSLDQIPRAAKDIGFEGVIMGIWAPDSHEEVESAIAAKNYVDGYCVGHMGLNTNYSLEILKRTIKKIKKRTHKFVTTTEGIDVYDHESTLIQLSDWIFPDSRLYWQNENIKHPSQLYKALLRDYERLIGRYEKPVLLKIVGFPTMGNGQASEKNQAELFKLLLQNAGHPYERLRFAYFEAFDQPWKTWHTVEAHWGVFKNDRSPKAGVDFIWGKNLTYSYEDGLKNKAEHSLWITFLLIGCANAAAGCAYWLSFIRTRQEKNVIRLTIKEKKIERFYHKQLSEIKIEKTHQKCFDILLYFIDHIDRPLMCGEIITQINDKVFECCSYTQQDGCQEKKERCQPYRTLCNHRIRVIKKFCRDHNIGNIANVAGESKWRLTLAENVEIEIVG